MSQFSNVTLYDWVPFFGEVASKLAEIGKDKVNRTRLLREKAFEIFHSTPQMEQLPYFDPLSFIYLLAQKNTTNQFDHFYSRVKEQLGINAPPPTDRIYPTPTPQALVLFCWGDDYYKKDSSKLSVEVLWDFFLDAAEGRELNEVNFNNVLSLKGVKIAKLSQVLCLIDATRFWSVDDNSLWLPIFSGREQEFKNIDVVGQGKKYNEFLDIARKAFPGCDLFEINLFAYVVNGDSPTIKLTNNYGMISSKLDGNDGHDYFDDFTAKNAVWTGVDGGHMTNGIYDVNKTNPGDIMLVRRGRKNLGGIGFVIDNEFQPAGYAKGKVIKIIWVNKVNIKLQKGLGDWKGFNSTATDDTWEKFYTVYDGTLDLMELIFKKQQKIITGMDNNTNGQLENMPSLNTILYGPPGTGKTYHTIVKAAEIITGESFADPTQYAQAKKLVKYQLNQQDQVEFVTFHQNYSYEDFVAGLRPDTDGASIGLRFTEHRGIFYRINERAKRNWIQHRSGQTFTEPTFEEVLEVFLQPLIEDQEIEVSTIARNANFHITNNNGKNLGFRKKSGGTGHTLSISTLKDLYDGKRDYSLQGLGIYFRPVVDRLKQLAAGMRQETGKIGLKNFVLIIDEINRANISRVFGELITLLEDDKRLGAENELKLRLPGLPDEELFGVAPNLFIVGTMNTADKSIALIDIALRRRFVFEDMYPRDEVVNRLLPNPYNIYLLALNEKIKGLKGPDFMIGHAYFIGKTGDVKIVADVFNQKIIPLLNEYFYNQRNARVFDILQCTPLPGIVFVSDPFIGAKAIVQ